MKAVEEIREQFAGGNVTLSKHALTRLIERNISKSEIQEAGRGASIIEDYPDDKYSPNGLIFQ
jgi:hypothetical protein